MKKPVLFAALTMVGTIIGAGIFGVPFVFSQAGALIGLAYCAVLGATAVVSHLLYARVAAATPGRHRLVGYSLKHLGHWAADIVSVTNPLGLLGSLLAYLILGGGFLFVIFGGSEIFWALAFFAVMSLALVFPFRRLMAVEAVLTVLLIAVALAVVFFVSPHVRVANLADVNLGKWFLPYGVIFFSFGGISAVPDIVEVLKKKMNKVALAVVGGTAVSVVITAVFGLVVAGASGAATTENAMAGLVSVVGDRIVVAGALFGLLAVATSFLTIGENIKEQFKLDLRLSRAAAWAAAVGIPLAAYLFGARDFIGVIGFVGAVFGVVDGIIIALMARRVVKGHLRVLTIPLIVIFVVGIVSEIITLTR